MNVEHEIAKASEIMSRYRMSKDDQIRVATILLDAGVERCLQTQEQMRQEKEALIEHAQKNPSGRRWMN